MTQRSTSAPADAHLAVSERGRLTIDRCDAVEPAERFGVPLWVISQRAICDNVARRRGAVDDMVERSEVRSWLGT